MKPQEPTRVWFVFGCPPAKDEFVFELADPARIEHARKILRGEEKRKIHVSGIIRKQRAAYNPAWSFDLDPASISFFELAMELCDAAIRHVEEHLEEVGGAFLPDNRWCPWSSRLLRELPASN